MKTTELYVDEKVKVKRAGTIVTGYVVEVGDEQFCIHYDDTGEERWINNSAVIR